MSDNTGERYSKKEKNIMRFLPKQQNDRSKEKERVREKTTQTVGSAWRNFSFNAAANRAKKSEEFMYLNIKKNL